MGSQKKTRKRKKNRVIKEGILSWILANRLIMVSLILFLVAGAAGITFYYAYGYVTDFLRIRKVVVKGNRYLSMKEVILLTELRGRESLLRVSSRDLRGRLLRSPWIKDVVIRKELPDTIVLKIMETAPRALLKKNGHMYIVDKSGRILEEMSNTVPFLPVIKMSGNRKDTLIEALKLAGVIRESEFLSNEEVVIDAEAPYRMTLRVGDLLIKVGKGDYRSKLSRLAHLEKEIISRGIPIKYIDLRFSRRVIVRASSSPGNSGVRSYFAGETNE